LLYCICFFFSSRRRHTRFSRDWSSDVCSSDLVSTPAGLPSMLNVFLEYLDGKPAGVLTSLASVRRVFASGEALPPSHVRKFNDEIGRASCRERVERTGVEGGVERKKRV